MFKKIKIIDLVLILTIFYHVFLTSYWTMSHTGEIWSQIGFGFVILLAFIACINFLGEKFTTRKFWLAFFIGCLVVFCFYKRDIDMIKFFIVCFASIQMDKKRILQSYFTGILMGIFFVLSLFLLGLLPKVNDDGLLSYGFRNPNSLGFLLFVLFGIFIIFLNFKKYFILLIFCILLPFLCFKLEDHTAAILLTLNYFLYLVNPFWKKLVNLRISKWLLSLLPFILTFTAIWIGRNYYTYYWMQKLNEVFTSRPALWNFYLSNFPITKFGVKLPENINFGHGAFDGAYVTFPILNGYIVFGIMLLILSFGLFFSAKRKSYYLLPFMIVIIIYGFSENAPFINLYSPLFSVCLSLIAADKEIGLDLEKMT